MTPDYDLTARIAQSLAAAQVDAILTVIDEETTRRVKAARIDCAKVRDELTATLADLARVTRERDDLARCVARGGAA